MTRDLLHGGSLDHMRKTFPNAVQPWIDLSTGINPWPWPAEAIHGEVINRLPTAEAFDAAQRAMAAAFGAHPTSLLPGPGSELLIRLLPTLIQPQKIAILSRTYSDHKNIWAAQGCDIVETDDPLSYADRTDAVVLCNPNNPDGRSFAPAAVDAARSILAARNGWLIIDEAYADLEPAKSVAPYGGAEGLIILRSMGKFYGLAGLRMGAMIAPPDILDRLAQRLGVWSISGPALKIASDAYRDVVWREEIRKRLRKARARLDTLLSESGLTICGGTDLFAFVDTDDAPAHWSQLAQQGIYVRRFEWTKRHLRIGLPPDETSESRLAAALSLLT